MKNIDIYRQDFEKLGSLYPKAENVVIEQVSISNINCYWFRGEIHDPRQIVIYLHGGAFGMGSIRSHGNLVSHLSKKLNTIVLFIDYSLAPENLYPAGRNDVIQVYHHLLEVYLDCQFTFIGDSAGGGLTVSVIWELQRQKMQMPQGVALISPWINLACNYPSFDENRDKDVVLNKDHLIMFAALYSGDNTILGANPATCRLTAFPPALIIVGGSEILLDDSRELYQNLKNIQENTTLTVYDGQQHVWPLADITSEASQQTLNEIKSFFKSI